MDDEEFGDGGEEKTADLTNGGFFLSFYLTKGADGGPAVTSTPAAPSGRPKRRSALAAASATSATSKEEDEDENKKERPVKKIGNNTYMYTGKRKAR